MQEAAFSSNFHLYTGEGLPMQMTIRGADFDEFQNNLTRFFAKYPQAGSANMLLREQPVGTIRPLTVHIVGWLRGDTEDKYSGGGKTNPCVYLYSNNPSLEYAAATVYAEKLDRLPAFVDWQRAPSMGNMAPPVKFARSKMNECNFKIVLMPQFDAGGNPVLNKNGKQAYKFDHVILDDAPVGEDIDFGGSTNRTEAATRDTEKRLARKEHAELDVYAKAIASSRVKLSPALQQLCATLQQQDRESTRRMSVTRMENGEKKTGRYDFLAGILDKLAEEPMHRQVLSFMLARPVTAHESDLPGDNMSPFISNIWPGSSAKPNPEFRKEAQDLVREAIAACKALSIVPDDVFA